MHVSFVVELVVEDWLSRAVHNTIPSFDPFKGPTWRDIRHALRRDASVEGGWFLCRNAGKHNLPQHTMPPHHLVNVALLGSS